MKNGINAMLFDMSVGVRGTRYSPFSSPFLSKKCRNNRLPDDLQMGSRQPEFQCRTWRLHNSALSTS